MHVPCWQSTKQIHFWSKKVIPYSVFHCFSVLNDIIWCRPGINLQCNCLIQNVCISGVAKLRYTGGRASTFIHCSQPTNSNRLPHGMGLHCPLPMTPVGEGYMVFSIKRNLQGPESLSINGSVSMKFQKQFI